MNTRRAIVLGLSLVIALAAIFSTRFWVQAPRGQSSAKASPAGQSILVDEQPMVTAQALAPLAVTREEQDFAQEVLRVADHELDLAFASALRAVTQHPAPSSPAAREILARIQGIQARVKLEQDDVARLKVLLPKTAESQKQAREDELQLEEALLEVDQEELDAAQQELIRVGGDPQSVIQRLMDQHEAWHQRQSAGGPAVPAPDSPRLAIEETPSQSFVTQFQAWRLLDVKEKQLAQAQQEVESRAAGVIRQRQQLQEELSGGQASGPAQSGEAAPAQNTGSAESALFPLLKRVAEQQQDLGGLDKRADDLQQLQELYGNWASFVDGKKSGYTLSLVRKALWILVVVLLIFLADQVFRMLFSRLAPEKARRMHTLRTVVGFGTQVLGLASILLIVFGPPSQLATVVALAGAGLTVALKDFIVGFFGWFVLMGRNGIRPGDWVEIEGVAGEVLEVGLLHTVILETGSWSDAGHPTGRKVTFVNSFAIEGHYFNFSTSGQWLWDEIQVPVPEGADPYLLAEAIQTIVSAETQADAQLAEREWQRVVPSGLGHSFSAAAAINVRPTSSGVNVLVRYITHAHGRHDVRSRLYHQIVEILRRKQSSPSAEVPRSVSASS